MIAKEERRIHAFSSINNINNIDEVTMKKELIMMANHLDESGYKREADFLDQLIKKAGDDVVGECGATPSAIRIQPMPGRMAHGSPVSSPYGPYRSVFVGVANLPSAAAVKRRR